MHFIKLIGFSFIFYFTFTTEAVSGNFLPCTDNANCTVAVSSVSCFIPGGFCQCPAGYVFTTDFTQCIKEVLYGVECTNGVQCAHMLTGAYCNENNVCSCKDTYTYVRGKCRQLVKVGEYCNDDIDCDFNFNRESVICRNNACTCADGFYLRTENVCRRISKNAGELCIVNSDCQGSSLSCLESNNTCVGVSVGIQTELYSLPETKSVSIQADESELPLISDETEEPKKFGDTCTIEGDECTGLFHSVCKYGLCRCKEGYYILNEQCKAELGETANSKEYCSGDLPNIEYRDGKCVCALNLFSTVNLKTCIKASTGFGNGCTQDSQCTPYGLSHCTPNPRKECRCLPYAEYDPDTQFCIHKTGYEQYCTNSNQCTVKNTVCSNENTCICGPNYIEINKVCRPGEGAECATTAECGFENSECDNNQESATDKKYCKCKKGFVYYQTECIPEVEHEEECTVDEQCKPLLGDLSECKENQCVCEDGAHFKDNKCNIKKQVGESCTRSSECYVEENPDRVVCRNGVCNCKFEYKADVEKQQCIIVKSKNSSGRPSPLKVITIILMTSAALITSAAIREAYFVR